MKKFIYILLITIVLTNLQSCVKPNDYSTNLSEYSLWHDSTEQILCGSFSDTLPSNDIVSKYGKNYYYKASKALLGDENFVIIVELQFSDVSIYEDELYKYSMFDSSIIKSDSIYYVVQASQEHISKYMDDEISDGIFYNFEFIKANINECSMCIVNARVWDYYKDELLIEYMQNMVNT